MIHLNQIYSCPHCKTQIAVLQGRFSFSFLPVEIINGTEVNDGEYDKEKHKSHLLNCPQLQSEWPGVKKKILQQMKKQN